MKKSLFAALALLLAAQACNSGASQEQELQTRVIQVHDEVMPLMGDFAKNSIRIDSLLANLPELAQKDAELDTLAARQELEQLQQQLDQARENMNDWMHELQLEHEGKSKEEILQYYQQELDRITKVKEEFQAASEQSSSILPKYTQ